MTSSEIYEEVMHAAYEKGIAEDVRVKMEEIQKIHAWKDRTEALIEAYQFVKKLKKKKAN